MMKEEKADRKLIKQAYSQEACRISKTANGYVIHYHVSHSKEHYILKALSDIRDVLSFPIDRVVLTDWGYRREYAAFCEYGGKYERSGFFRI